MRKRYSKYTSNVCGYMGFMAALVYNILKLQQNILFGNVKCPSCYILKYTFYLFNAGLAWIVKVALDS